MSLRNENQKRDLMRIISEDVDDERVIEAVKSVPRERFVLSFLQDYAYDDSALPIAEGQTISQPSLVAFTLASMDVRPMDRVLEVGAGSGYQAALLSKLAREVVTVERVPELAKSARKVLSELGCANVRVVDAEEELGWARGAPYDSAVVAAAAPHVPQSLIKQLTVGGRLLVPVGDLQKQTLTKVTKTRDGFLIEPLISCRYVPLISDGDEGGWTEEEARERHRLNDE